MTIVRWEPVRESGALQHEINRLFGGFFEQPTGQASSGATQRQWVPAMDLVETDGAYVLRADLPGLGAGDVKIELEENVLTISGERETQHEQRRDGYHRFERASGAFARTLTLPAGIDADGIEASFSDGVLEVRIPAPEQRKPRRVTITTAGAASTLESTEAAQPAPAPDTLAAAAA